MSKYAPEQLRTKARSALRARTQNDLRYSDLVMGLCVKTGLNPVQVEQRIKALANGL